MTNQREYIYQLQAVTNGGGTIIGNYDTLHLAMNIMKTPPNYCEWIESNFCLLYIPDRTRLPPDRDYDIIRSTYYQIERYYKSDHKRVCTEPFKLPSQ